jgi:hypothetical protein
MTEPLYQIVFRGKLLTGFSPEQVQSNLAKLFRTDEARIAAMLAQPKWVVKAGVDKVQAQKIQDALRTAGMMVAIMTDAPAAPPTEAPAPVVPRPVPVVVAAPIVVAAPNVGVPNVAPPSAAIVAPASATALPSAPETETAADAPLAVKPKIAAFNPDLSAYSLAEVGAIMDSSGPKKLEQNFALAQFSLAEVGAQIIEKKPFVAKQIDTSAMSLAKVEDVKAAPSALLRAIEG